MKLPYKNLLICSTLLLLFSCSSSDDASKTNVKYIVTSTANIITSVMYRGTNGEVTEAVGDGPVIEWSKSLNVNDPYNAYLEVSALNTDAEAHDYDLAIYIDGELVEYLPVEVPPGENQSATLEFDID